MNYHHIQVEQDDNILIVRLHRPEKLNAINYPMFDELIDVSRKVKHDRAIRAVILTGSGDNFSSGLDFNSIMASKMGLTSDMAGSLTLREIMPKDQAMKISMCATQLDAKTALQYALKKKALPMFKNRQRFW